MLSPCRFVVLRVQAQSIPADTMHDYSKRWRPLIHILSIAMEVHVKVTMLGQPQPGPGSTLASCFSSILSYLLINIVESPSLPWRSVGTPAASASR